jgi:hypothetical protein
MGGCAWGVGLVGALPVAGILILQVLTGGAVYVFICALLGVPEQEEMLAYAKGLVLRKLAPAG